MHVDHTNPAPRTTVTHARESYKITIIGWTGSAEVSGADSGLWVTFTVAQGHPHINQPAGEQISSLHNTCVSVEFTAQNKIDVLHFQFWEECNFVS